MHLPSISHILHIYKITHALKSCTDKNTHTLSHTPVKFNLCPVPHLCNFTHSRMDILAAQKPPARPLSALEQEAAHRALTARSREPQHRHRAGNVRASGQQGKISVLPCSRGTAFLGDRCDSPGAHRRARKHQGPRTPTRLGPAHPRVRLSLRDAP